MTHAQTKFPLLNERDLQTKGVKLQILFIICFVHFFFI